MKSPVVSIGLFLSSYCKASSRVLSCRQLVAFSFLVGYAIHDGKLFCNIKLHRLRMSFGLLKHRPLLLDLWVLELIFCRRETKTLQSEVCRACCFGMFWLSSIRFISGMLLVNRCKGPLFRQLCYAFVNLQVLDPFHAMTSWLVEVLVLGS